MISTARCCQFQFQSRVGFELVINPKIAKASIPLLGRADE
jgi:hypothetical protein